MVLLAVAAAVVLPAAAHAAPPDAFRVAKLLDAAGPKAAVVLSAANRVGQSFTVLDAAGAVVLNGTLTAAPGSPAPWARAAKAVFSSLGTAGVYRVKTGTLMSVPFRIGSGADRGVLDSLLGIYNANADGQESSSHHGPSHLNDAASKIRNGPHTGETVDVSGGWMDSGDQLKFTGTIAYAATMLQLAARNEPTLAVRLRGVADVGIRWLLKAHPSPDVYVSMVGDLNADHNNGTGASPFRNPAGDDGSSIALLAHRPTAVLTPQTGGADVAGAVATALALAAQRETNATRRGLLTTQARAWLAQGRTLGRVWTNCCYQQDSYRDDLASAAAELWRLGGAPADATAALADAVAASSDGAEGWRINVDGYDMAALPAAELCGVLGAPAVADVTAKDHACALLRAGGSAAADDAATNAFGRAGPLTWGSLRNNAAGSAVAWLAWRAGMPTGHGLAFAARDYFLGRNPWGRRFQTGYGIVYPYHWAQLVIGPNAPLGAVPGGPASLAEINANTSTPMAAGPFDTAAAAYRDAGFDYVTNELGIPYNAAPVLQMALLSPG